MAQTQTQRRPNRTRTADRRAAQRRVDRQTDALVSEAHANVKRARKALRKAERFLSTLEV